MFSKKDPVSDWSEKQQRKQMKKDWLQQTDPIRRYVYYTLPIFKLVLIALFAYLFVLTISEGFYLLRDAVEGRYGKIYIKPKGGYEQLWQYPKKTINVVGVDVKNFGFKKQTNTLRSFVLDANVTEEL
jgi:hypothetical protein